MQRSLESWSLCSFYGLRYTDSVMTNDSALTDHDDVAGGSGRAKSVLRDASIAAGVLADRRLDYQLANTVWCLNLCKKKDMKWP